MEFLVTMRLDRGRVPADRLDRLLAEERLIARDLREEGAIVRIWAVPERGETISVWQADSRAGLDSLLGSLPLRGWLHVDVVPLSTHYLEADPS